MNVSGFAAASVSGALLISSIFASTPSAIHAQVTVEEAACRATIAKFAGKHAKAARKTILSCHKLRDKGKLPEGTDCSDLAVADSRDKVLKAANKVRQRVGGEKDRCSLDDVPLENVLAEFLRCPVPAETADDDGATDGIDDFGELAECLIAHAEQMAEDRLTAVMGLPAAGLSKEQQKCRGAIAKVYSKIVDTTVKERTKCQAASDKAGGPIDFDDCVDTDDEGKIANVIAKGRIRIDDRCATSVLDPLARRDGARSTELDEIDSCGDNLAELKGCIIDDNAAVVGSGAAALLWELPGTCPGAGAYLVLPTSEGTEADTGFTGNAHDLDPILGHRGAVFGVVCDVDSDCTSCVGVAPGSPIAPPPGACSCGGAGRVKCSSPGADPACNGGDECKCLYGPPTPYSVSGTPACVVTMIDGTMTGSLDVATGAVDLNVPALSRIYLSPFFAEPCPRCEGGLCTHGARAGRECRVAARDASFGSVSYDCPPSSNYIGVGAGTITSFAFTTGTRSTAFGAACTDPAFSSDLCACGVCSGDTAITCNSDADCAALGQGTCTGTVPGASTRPNSCADGVCSADGGADEGTCLAGPSDTFCDTFLRSNGDGILPCANDTDCSYWACPAGDCGSCTLAKNRDCFLDPVVAQGVPGDTVVSVGCVGVTTSPSVNSSVGWPGVLRVKQKLGIEAAAFCSDGVTPFIPPGGSNCP